jgi:aspartyl/asparaginyl-tRNA synthetase
MTFRDIILSDHEWSEDEDEMNEEFIDHDDEEIIIHDISNTIKPFYRV